MLSRAYMLPLWMAAALSAAIFGSAPVFAQGAVQAYQPQVYGHGVMFGPQNNYLMDAGGPTANGQPPVNLTNPGTSPLGSQWVNSGLGTCGFSAYANTTYSSLCWGFDGSGNGVIALNGTGTPPSFSVQINGINYPFPGAGNGNVVGPTSPAPTSGDIVCWNSGTAVKDCPTVSNPVAFANTVTVANTITGTVNNSSARTSAGWNNLFRDNSSSVPSDFTSTGNFDNLVSLVTSPNGTTLVNTTAFAAYIHNQTPNVTPTDYGNSVLYYGIIKSETNGAHSWGLNPVMNDEVGLTGVVMQNEFDVNVFSTSSKAYGLVVVGASTVSATDSAGVAVGSPSLQSIGTAEWTRSFWSQDAASPLAFEVGATGVAGASVNGQKIRLHYYNSGSTLENLDLAALSSGQLAVSSFVTAAATGVSAFNNLSTTANTASTFNASTISGSALFTQVESGGGASALDITETGTGGIAFFPGGGGITASGTSVWTANGSVGTTMTSLGPAGAHTTVQEWFTVRDTAGNVRYIPAY